MCRFDCGQGRFDATRSRPDTRLIEALRVSFLDGQKFSQHPGAVSPRTNFRAWLIGPVDGNFRDTVAPLAGNVEYFQIECVAVDTGHGKQILSNRLTE